MYVDHLTMGPGLQDLVSTPKEKNVSSLSVRAVLPGPEICPAALAG